MKNIFLITLTYLLLTSFSGVDSYMPKYKGSTCDADSLRSNISSSRNNENVCACCVASQRLLSAYITNISESEQEVERIQVRSSEGEMYYQESYACESLIMTPENRKAFRIHLPEKVGTLNSTDFGLVFEIFSKDVITREAFSQEIALNYVYCN